MPVSEGAYLFGVRIDRFKLIDYYSVPWEDVPARTPPPLMIATRDLATRKQEPFAWHLVAESQRILPEEILSQQTDLERLVLQAFFSHLHDNPRTWWLHWGLHGVDYGFPALAQRAKSLGIRNCQFPERRMIDLAELLKRRLGEDYVPHRRLQNLILLNNVNRHGLMDVPELTTAFRAGEFARMLRSLLRKLDCISRIVELGAAGSLQTAGGQKVLLSGSEEKDKVRWMTCARGVLDDGRVADSSAEPTLDSGAARAAKATPFIPTELQLKILSVLEGRAMTQDVLASKLNCDRSALHRNGLKELMARGKVQNHRRVGGYYRPDAPPPAYQQYLQEPPNAPT